MIFLVTPRAHEDADRQRVIEASSASDAAKKYFEELGGAQSADARRLSVREVKPFFFHFTVREQVSVTVEEEKE